jgi:RHS repeat-associated protein
MSDWSLLGLDGDPAPGDPGRTRTLAKRLLDDAELAERNTGRLRDISSTDSTLRMEGDYAAGFREALGELPGELAKLGRAYRGCGQALSDFAGSLDDAKTRAAAALRQGRDAHGAYQGALRDVRSLLPPDRHAAVSGRQGLSEPNVESSTAGLDEGLRAQVRAAAARGRSAEADRARARRLADEAARIRGEAETRCERGIRSALEGIKNKEWYEKAWDFVSTPFRSWEDFVNLARNVAMVAGVVALFISGPIGLALVGIALVAGAVVFADTLNKYRQGKAGLGALALDALGLIPGARGVLSAAKLAGAARGLAGAVRSGGRAIPGALRNLRSRIPSLRDGITNVRTNAVEYVKRTLQRDPVDVATGDVVVRQTDVELPGALPLVLTRTHLSSYRSGRWFGPSWASTLDQRLEVDATGVCFAAADGALLSYPVPDGDAAVLAEEGARLPLRRSGDHRYTVFDRRTGESLHFAPAGVPGGTVLPLAAVTDRNGNRIDLHYGPDGDLTEIRHSGGYRITVETAAGRVTALLLQDGADRHALIRFSYGPDGALTGVVNSSGRPMRLDYDRAGRIVRWEDRNGTWYRYTYDDGGRCVHGTGPGGRLAATFTYTTDERDPSGPGRRTTVVTDSFGHATVYQLNAAAQVVRETDPLGHTTTLDWDRYDRLTAHTDTLGRTTAYHYDERGNLTGMTRPDRSRITVRHDDRDRPVATVGPDGAVWQQEYDEHGNVISTTDPLGATTRRGYDERGRLSSITDAAGRVRRVDNDAAGLPVAVTDPLGNTTRYERDAFGRIVAVTDPLGGTTRLGWTAEGKLARHVLPDRTTRRWRYDDEGNVVEHVDPLGQRTRTDVTHFDLPAARIEVDGGRMTYEYDTELRPVAVRNPQGLVWRYEYDPVGNLVRETDFNGRVLTYTYDAAGQLVARVNGAGQRTEYTRDPLGNVVEQRCDGSSTTFAYDVAGRMVHASNADADLVLQRDAVGRVRTESCNGRSVTWEYDILGRRVLRRTPSGVESSWEYDAVDRPTAVRTGGRTVRFGYDAAGREVERHIGEALRLSASWDAASRLRSRTLAGAAPDAAEDGAPLRTWAYDYRPDGYPTRFVAEPEGERRIGLDPVGRVRTVDGEDRRERYTYDAAGNITQADWSSPDGAGEARGTRDYAGTLIRRAGRVRYDHDPQGRVVAKRSPDSGTGPGLWRYTWDGDDRLVAVDTPDGGRWRYRHDPLGRRIAKQRLAADGTVADEVGFAWDGLVLAERYDFDGGTGPAGGQRVTTWDWEPGEFRPVSQAEHVGGGPDHADGDSRWHAIVTDLVGTPTDLLAPDGTVAWHAGATMWGTGTAAAAAGVDCPLRFPGQYHDAETGDHYNHQRYYDPATARYLTADPLGLSGDDDPYQYVPNPTVWIDPLGLARCQGLGTKFDVPQTPGVYTIHLNSGSKYVGSTTSSMHERVTKSMRSKHAVRRAGYTAPDVENVTFFPLSPGVSAETARRVEQTVMEGWKNFDVWLVNRRDPEIAVPFGGYF